LIVFGPTTPALLPRRWGDFPGRIVSSEAAYYGKETSVAKSSVTSSSQPLFHLPDPYQRFVQGARDQVRATPADIAWQLEADAVRQGWIVGRFVGSQSELMRLFGSSRESIREAVRILEARRSMSMQRGRKGGLRLAEPDLDWAAAAFVMCLRGLGFGEPALRETIAVARPLIGALPQDHVVARLYRSTLDRLDTTTPHLRQYRMRSIWIATHIIQRYAPIPADGLALAHEEELCAQLCSSRATYRQALRILDDLGMLRLRRGRGGGYILKRPSPIGVVRQIFALLACKRQTIADLLPIKATLDILNLRLAMRALARLEALERSVECDALEISLSGAREPQRWCALQQAIGGVANNPLVGTLLWGVVAYALRVESFEGFCEGIDANLLQLQRALLQAMREGQASRAEHVYSRIQMLVSTQYDRQQAERHFTIGCLSRPI
jgi:DNA-binding FadR family transcriptional regulator